VASEELWEIIDQCANCCNQGHGPRWLPPALITRGEVTCQAPVLKLKCITITTKKKEMVYEVNFSKLKGDVFIIALEKLMI